jgi:hypothetical protein
MLGKGDTLTYTLGAMKPESASASVVTAGANAKQLALNEVGGSCRSKVSDLGPRYDTDVLLVDRSLSRQYISSALSSSSSRD